VLRLIVNADDLGLTSGVNRAILQSNRDGIVSSATLMANARALPEAVSLLQSTSAYRERKLGIGCHIVLIDGSPLSPPQSISTLLDPDSKAPRFRSKMWKFALAAARGNISVKDVETEASTQIRELLDAGIELSHVDCHKHSHMFPAILEGVLRAAKTHGIGAIRNPFEPSFARPFRLATSGKNAVRSAETALLNAAYAKQFRRKVREYGLNTTDGSIGVTVTGTLNAQAFQATVRNLPADGVYEFVCHPGYNDAELASAGTRLLQSRETELSVLCSKEARQALEESGTELINFWDLVAAAESNHAASHPMP
jgi:chitin disaccharide deacetylase